MKKMLLPILLVFASLFVHAAEVDTIQVFSKAMQKDIKVVVVKPAQYKKKKLRFPVVYLLHGYSGSYAQWVKDAPLLMQHADKFNQLLVCPDGGYNSWYFDSPVESSVRYETFCSSELINAIDGQYRTIADKSARAITGLSMGGHGAMYLAIRHTDVFGAAGSICGGVDIRPFPKNTVINVVDQLQNGTLKLIIDCGLGDFFLQVNRAFHQKLVEKKIDHEYIERPGVHNKAYWGNAIGYQLYYFNNFFAPARP
jgi:S-formylglutathione hydrolase FrmB